MSDRFSTELWIGGVVPINLVPTLCKAIRDEGIATDWDEPAFKPKTWEHLHDSLQDGALFLCDREASYGTFPELIKVLKLLRLPYDLRCEGKYEYDPTLEQGRPNEDGTYCVLETSTDHVGNPVVSVNAINEILRKTELLPDTPKGIVASPADRMISALTQIHELLPQVTPLPPLELGLERELDCPINPQATPATCARFAEQHNLIGFLDGQVHDACSARASEINNAGTEAQTEYLCELFGAAHVWGLLNMATPE